MINPVSLDQLLANDPIGDLQAAIVSTLHTLLPGVTIARHPGKVDISELIAKTVVPAPGIGIGWSRLRPEPMADGSYSVAVDWVAYIVAEAKVIDGRRREKEEVALAIGGQLVKILSDVLTSLWGRTGILPITQDRSAPDMRPLFTIKDASQGTAYYTVAWTQCIADIGTPDFPAFVGHVDPDNLVIDYLNAAELAAIAPWIPARQVPDDPDAPPVEEIDDA